MQSPWSLRRSNDSNETTNLAPGSFLFVTRGTNYQNVGFILKKDQRIQKIVSGWPKNFLPKKALELGFKAEKNFEEIINTYIEDELK